MGNARCWFTLGGMLEGPGPKSRRVGRSRWPHLSLCLSDTELLIQAGGVKNNSSRVVKSKWGGPAVDNQGDTQETDAMRK